MRHQYWFSRLWKPMAQYCTVDGVNYWPIVSYFVFATNRFFPELPGAGRILALIDALVDAGVQDRSVIETDEPDAPVIFQLAAAMNAHCAVPPLRRRWYQHAVVLRQLLRLRAGTRRLLGLLRAPLRSAQRAAPVLFLVNTRFERQGRVPFFDGIRAQLAKNGVASNYVFYTGISDLKGFLRAWPRHLCRTAPYLGDYYTSRTLRDTERAFAALRKAWARAREQASFRALFTYRGVPFFDALEPHLALAFDAFAYMAAESVAAAQAIAQHPFSVIVLDHEENMYGKGVLLMLRGRKDGRSSLALSHELIYPGCVHCFAPDRSVWRGAFWRPLPDRKCVGGERAKQVLTRYCNYPAGRIAVTGLPQLDSLFVPRDRENVLRAHGLDPQERHILVVSTKKIPSYELYERIAKENPSYTWVLKPHPKGREPIIRAFREHNPPRNLRLVAREANTQALLAASDAVLAGRTTVAMEAACLGKLVFILNPDGEPIDQYLPVREGIVVRSPEELHAALRTLEEDAARQRVMRALARYARAENAGNDGRASERVAQEILTLLRSAGRPRRRKRSPAVKARRAGRDRYSSRR